MNGDEQPTGDRLDRAKAAILTAQELAPGAAAAWLRAELADDPPLRDYVVRLLRGSDAAETRFGAVRAAAAEMVADARPQRIGRYTILGTLGQGGMGTVYLAEQTEPVHRRVALKLVKLGMDSAAVVQRFELERQALAWMEHDGIAKVHDCGTSERGQPFFVMELVEGEPVTAYCDARRLPLAARLQLLQRICDAVQHAHQKGVVHRDLKPGNVLVADGASGEPRVKVIDFGLAKAMEQRLADSVLLTTPGQIIGTVEYMAPEQADAANADVDTRADVYSLGVLLYELLVGSLPFADTELRRAGLLELQRILRDVEPPRPSLRLAALPDDERERIAAARATTASVLQRRLATDLDWVVQKAIEKDRDRRYDSAAALAADLQRFLDHEPLAAGPPSAGYRLRKLVRRNRGRVLAGAAVVATAVIGGVVATNFAVSALRLADEKSQKVREFDQLAGVVLLERAVERERELYPAWPARIEAMERWLRDDAGALLAMRPEIERTVGDLRARALPRSDAVAAADRRSHPRWAELEHLRAWVETSRRARAARAGAPLPEPQVPERLAGLDLQQLYRQVLARVSSERALRTLAGDEAVGLAGARLLVERAANTPSAGNAWILLGHALHLSGRDDEARAALAAAVAAAPPADHDSVERHSAEYERWIATADDRLAEEEVELAALQHAVEAPRTFEFDLESDRFLHDTLVRLLAGVADLEATQLRAVEERLQWARHVGAWTRAHPDARHSWDDVRAALAAADGVVASERYRGVSIELTDELVTGLVPIGMNPATKLWEFYDLRSAWDGEVDPATLAIPRHAADGSLEIGDDPGLVFVLLPGGPFLMGSQSDDPSQPNYDADAAWYVKPPHQVRLDPFLLSRFELTQAQWARLWRGDPAGEWPSKYRAGAFLPALQVRITKSNPVDQVDWSTSLELLRRGGMSLPTEAQWEYACRAGTDTPWSCAVADLPRCANVADDSARRANGEWPRYEAWADGFVVSAPVGSLRPNAWGFHDMHGNVAEWCRDAHGSYEWDARDGDGLRTEAVFAANERMTRGGNNTAVAMFAKSAMRTPEPRTLRAQHVGLRPSRSLRRR